MLIDGYLRDAIEVDVDAIADGTDVFVCGVMQHIEEAGIHSGDSACSLPPYSLSDEVIARAQGRDGAAGAGTERCHRPDERAVRGQGRRGVPDRGEPARQPDCAVRREGDRQAHRLASLPASHGWRKSSLSSTLRSAVLEHIAVKEAVFPFARFPGVDPILGTGNALDRRGHGDRPQLRAWPSPRAS